MLPLVIGLIVSALLAVAASVRDPVGLGLLLSTHVDDVADARLVEPVLGLPPLYVLSAAAAGVGAVLGLPVHSLLARWALGVLVASFILLTLWDMRRRRGTLAVYIRMRRAEIGFEPRGDVIEVPKLVFLVMNEPTPVVWLLTAVALAAVGALLYPTESWTGMLPLLALAAAIFWLWLRNRKSAWELLARRLRWLSLRSGERLTEPLEHALDLDPEVLLVRRAADEAVARFLNRDE